MPTVEDVFRKQMFKGEGLELQQRIFYTLTDKKELQAHRTAKAVSLLLNALVEKGVLSKKDIDELLFETV